MKKTLFILGTRPEVIKLAPVIKLFQAHPEFLTQVFTSGQHTDLVKQAISSTDIKVDGHLELKRRNSSLPELTHKLKRNLTALLEQQSPDLVFVHGDTSTALVGALAAQSLKIKVAHVEAGLRTYNLSSPYPEEANRQLIARLADYHFAPTPLAKENLLKEKVPPTRIIITGNTGIDTLLWAQEKAQSNSTVFQNTFTAKLSGRPLLLVTAHRREQQQQRIKSICLAIKEITSSRAVDVAFITHPNPQVKHTIQAQLKDYPVHLIDPLRYSDFVWLMSKAHLILTDSGGVQEEAPSLRVPVLVLREETERPEGAEAGGLEVVGMDTERIVAKVCSLLDDEEQYQSMIIDQNPYGDGLAAQRILDYVSNL